MNDDDPEKRLAELERPLLESAAASEHPAGAPRVGLRLGWALFGLMAIGLIVAAAFIFGGRSAGPVAGRPTTPPMVGGGGTVTGSPAAPTLPVPRLPATPPPTAALPSTLPPGRAVSVAGVGEKRTIACADNEVSVSGVDNEVILTGHCSRVDISGVENTVTIDAADAIDVSGMNNTVTFRSGMPELNNSGIGNTLGAG